MRLTLLQWNVWYKESAEAILRVIEELDPDIACLQELTQDSKHNPHNDIPQKITQLGYYSHFAAAIDRPGFIMGNGIFSKSPLRNTTILPTQLSDGSDSYDAETRLYLQAEMTQDDTSVHIGVSHLSYTDGFSQTHKRDIENQKILSQLNNHHEKFIFCGDFNATPEAELIRTLSQQFQHAGPDFAQKTWTTKPFSYNGFEANALDWRLDYVFCTRDIKIISSRIVPTEVSDHLPILIEFEL